MANINNFSRETIIKKGYLEVSNYFVGFKELEKIREVIFEYLKKYLLYESENLSLAEKISSGMKGEAVPDKILKDMRDEVIKLVYSFTIHNETRKIFEKIMGHQDIDICEGFLDFRANIPSLKKIPTGWHQDVETSFVENKNYWKHFSLTSWVALSNAYKENSIELIPKKENLFKIYPQHYGRIGGFDYANKPLREIDKELNEDNKYVVECKFDQCVFIDSFILHRTVPNYSNRPRFSMDIRYFDRTKNIKNKIKIHPKLYYFKFLKSKTYKIARDSAIGKITKYIRNLFRK